MRRLAATIALAALCAALVAACGGSSSGSSQSTGSTGSSGNPGGASAPPGASAQSCKTKAVGTTQLRASAVSCGEAQTLTLAWQKEDGCAAEPGASHSACSVRGYRCIGTAAAAGLAVSCARPGHAIAFIATRE